MQNLFGDGKSNKNAYILYYELSSYAEQQRLEFQVEIQPYWIPSVEKQNEQGKDAFEIY